MTPKEELKFLKDNENSLYVIHYSCQGLNDDNEGYSPRITSIAALHVESSTMHSFSIHLVAEIEKISREEIHNHYDKIEATMLEDFYQFVKNHQDCYWLHWNMSNINFGFETIEHRYRVLKDEQPPKVEDSKKHNLSSIITEIYGKKSFDVPRMPSVMACNGGSHRDSLIGAEEAEAFKRKEYLKLHKSTMAKVYFFQSIYRKIHAKKLKTVRSNFPAKLNRLVESLPAKILALVAVLYSVGQLSFSVFATLNDKEEVFNSEQLTEKHKQINKDKK
jgi:hypothetical protein